MNDALQQLLAQRLPWPGVVAWGARLADRTVASHCYTDWFTPRQIEQALTRLTLAAENLDQHRLRASRLCWTFEHARIHLAIRGDGACLALFVENRPGAPGAAAGEVLEEFRKLPAE